jgi:LPS-assembly lipoprotein
MTLIHMPFFRLQLPRLTWLPGVGLAVLASGLLAGCGFALRGSPNFAFDTVAVTPEQSVGVAAELSRYLGDKLKPLVPSEGKAGPQAVIEIMQELREKSIVGVTATGQVREFQLRLRVKFRLRTVQGVELIAPTELVLQRDISFNETGVLAKESEEILLYRDMQSDLVQQLLRRVAAIKSLTP